MIVFTIYCDVLILPTQPDKITPSFFVTNVLKPLVTVGVDLLPAFLQDIMKTVPVLSTIVAVMKMLFEPTKLMQQNIEDLEKLVLLVRERFKWLADNKDTLKD